MPQPVLHVALAHRTVTRWRRDPHPAPFPIWDATVNAFCHGALGPDMGFFPGGENGRQASRLAHTQDTAAIVRSLLARARTPVERAYAWGWVSHVLADIGIHPLVNRAAAEFRATPSGAATELVAHIRVAAGLDAWYLRRIGRAVRLRHALGSHNAGFVADALDDIYGLDIDEETVAGLHRNVTRWYGPYLHLANVIGRDQERDGDAPPPTFGVLGRVVSRVAGPASVATGFLSALPPSLDLIEGADASIREHDATIDAFARSGLEDLEDYSLETGERLEVGALAAA